MKVTEHINNSKEVNISLEILPPAKGQGIESVFKVLDGFIEFKPSFINITYHRAEQVFKKRDDGNFERIEIRKRPGTVGICAAIMNRYKIDVVPHIICGGFSKEETENALIDLHYLGVRNVLALRGDAAANEKFFNAHPKGHRYSEELVDQIAKMNTGLYLEDDIIDGIKSNFCIGVAGYPEKHIESPNIETDIYFLKRKIEKGASYITTQMFFNNEHYHNYVSKCRENDINVPIIPGLKPIYTKKQMSVLPSIFNVDIPIELTKELLKAKTDKDCELIGEEWLLSQCKDLIKHGTNVLHFYTLGKPQVVKNVIEKLI